jgi:nucleotide-binding universal stress UspA family protein
MFAVQRILCPVDFSATSNAAFDYADDFASWIGAELVVLHAFSQPTCYDKAGQWQPADAKILEDLHAVKSKHGSLKLKHLAHAGMPDEVICWAAEDQDCQLIIMGTHGRTGLQHLIFGSTAESVLKHARCPVVTIRPQKQDQPPLQEPIVTPMPMPRYL